MRKTLSLFLALLLTMIVTTADAQEWQTYKHEFDEKTVYVEVSKGLLLSWGVYGKDNCVMYPSVVEYKGSEVHFKGGTVWTIKQIKEGIVIEFPKGRNVTYLHTTEDPARICNIERGRKL